MKKTLRRTLSVLCALAIAASSMAVTAFAAEIPENAAMAGYAISDSVHTQYSEHVTERMNDGDASTRWQSNSKMYDAGTDGSVMPTYDTAPWGGIYWDEAITIGTLKVWFEASDPAKDGYEVYYAADYAEDATVWTQVTDLTIYRDLVNTADPANDNDSTDTIVFAEAVEAEAIKVVAYVAENKNVDLSIFEIEVYEEAENCSLNGMVTASNGTDLFVATNVAMEDIAEGQVILAEYTITRNGTPVSDSIVITNAWNSITLGDVTITAADCDALYLGGYVTGVLFTNVDAADEIEVTFSIVDAE